MKHTFQLLILGGLVCGLTSTSHAQIPGHATVVGSPYYWSSGSGSSNTYYGHQSPGVVYDHSYHSAPVVIHQGHSYGHGGYAVQSQNMTYPSGGGYGFGGGINPYYTHFGQGYYRHSEAGHLRFPYYSYRSPWYFPGPAVYNRDTNYAW